MDYGVTEILVLEVLSIFMGVKKHYQLGVSKVIPLGI